MHTNIELLKSISLLPESLQAEKLELLFILEKQIVFLTLYHAEATPSGVDLETLNGLWSTTYFARHKFMAATGNKPVAPSTQDKLFYLGTYLDYDVKNRVKKYKKMEGYCTFTA